MPKLIAVLVVVLVACGGGGGSSLALDDYPAALRDAFCEYAVACGDVADVAACRTTSLGQPVQLTTSQLAAIAAGTIVYRGSDAQACVDGLAARSCDVTSQSNRVVPDACFTVLVGTQGDGAACASDAQCVSQRCDVPVCDAACCLGTCVGGTQPGRAEVGESCETARCDDNAFCEAALCFARKNAGGECLMSDHCQFGLDCIEGACTALPAIGQPCDGACRDQGTTCSPISQTCVEVALAGAPCTMTSECSIFYVCDATKHCSPGLALDEPCTPGQRCGAAGAFCDAPAGESMGRCALPRELDEPCSSEPGCLSGRCDLTTQRCVAEPVCI